MTLINLRLSFAILLDLGPVYSSVSSKVNRCINPFFLY